MARSDGARADGLTAAQILAYLDSRPAPPRPPGHVRAYREAAAVLASVTDLDSLRPAGPAPAGKAAELLEPDLVRATGSAFAGSVMLRPEVRADAIRGLVAGGRVAEALGANPEQQRGLLQDQLRRYLGGRADPLASQSSLPELEATLQVAVWLAGVVDGVPSVAEVESRAGYLRLLAPFEALAGDDVFRGRQRELDRLRRYIGVIAPRSALERVRGHITRWAEPDEQPAISISGIGGAGKSSLVARFMLEHTRLPQEERLPFGYLDFARVSLDVGDPVGLSRELLRQLDLQFPGLRLADGFAFLRDWRPEPAAPASAEIAERAGKAASVLGDILGVLGSRLGPRPYVIVLDTFEEVQYRGEERAYPLWEQLGRLQGRWPFLRVVVAGRAPVGSLSLAGRDPRQIVLGDLDDDAAAAFLSTQGITDPLTQEDFIAAFGRLPLSLKLAAALAARTPGGAAALVGPEADGVSLAAASDEVTQARLYGRILDHLTDDRVRRLAHPGLTLRRINPEIILHVLNEPCDLLIDTIEEAAALFGELLRETSLVSVDSTDGDLVHRPDLRRVMLRALHASAPAQTAEIHRRAAQWYAGQPGARAAAEWVYHQLHLAGDQGQRPGAAGAEGLALPPEVLRTIREQLRTAREVRAAIEVALDEFPVQTQLWLAVQGFKVPPEVAEQASRDQAHAAAAAQVEDLLPYGESAELQAESVFRSAYQGLGGTGPGFRSIARSVLGRADRGASPVFRAGARVAAQRGDNALAQSLIEEGLERAVRDGAAALTLGLLEERAWLWRRRPAADQAEGLALLAEHAGRASDTAALLQHLAQSVSLDPPGPAQGPARERLVELHHLLRTATAQDLWDVLPALREPVEHALLTWDLARREQGPGGDAGGQPRLLAAPLQELAGGSKFLPGPFTGAAFLDRRSQEALNRLQNVYPIVLDSPGGRAVEQEFLTAFLGLCEAWPYRILYVSPPGGRAGEQLTL